jgi:hypothetical protein
LTSLELMISLAITAIVAVAITGMLGAVTQGVITRHDARSIMVRAFAAQSRLAAYIAPSRSLLEASGAQVVLWLDDSRESGTVHASEIRWLRYNAADGAIDVYFVEFPSGWTELQKDLADLEYEVDENWNTVFTYYQSNGWLLSIRLVDGLVSNAVTIDQATAIDSRQVQFALGFAAGESPLVQPVSATIALHRPPES